MTATDFGRFLPRLILLVILLGGAGCDLQVDSAGASTPNAQVEHIDLDDEVRRVLPNGTVIYYANLFRDRSTRIDHWSVKSLSIHSGTIRTLMNGDESGFSEILPHSLTQDGTSLLVSARKPRSDRRVLLEINTHTGKWRKIADDIFGGDYSPDGSKIAVYYPLIPEHFHQTKNKAIQVGIIDRNGNFIKKIDCESIRCSHASWEDNGNHILFIDETIFEKVKQFTLKSETIDTLFSAEKQDYQLSYPTYCNGKVIVTRKPKSNQSLIGHNKRKPVTHLFLDPKNNFQIINSITSQKHRYLTCIPGNSDIFIASETGELNNGVLTDLTHLVLLNLKTGNSYRLTPGPSLNTLTLDNVLYIP